MIRKQNGRLKRRGTATIFNYERWAVIEYRLTNPRCRFASSRRPFCFTIFSTGSRTRGYSPFGLRVFQTPVQNVLFNTTIGYWMSIELHKVLMTFYITKDDSTELMVILNLFQDLSAEKDKKRLAVRCWTKFSMTYGVICYLYSHFGKANSILLYNPNVMLNLVKDLSAEKE